MAEREWKTGQREPYIPFSAGQRVCTVSGFAMVEEALLLARLCVAYEFNPVAESIPQSVAHLIVRSKMVFGYSLRSGSKRPASLRAKLRILGPCSVTNAAARSGSLRDSSKTQVATAF